MRNPSTSFWKLRRKGEGRTGEESHSILGEKTVEWGTGEEILCIPWEERRRKSEGVSGEGRTGEEIICIP